MNTLILNAKDRYSIETCAEIIRSGGLCAFPTETVYGLGANGLDGKAVSKIFAAKGRPQDNPLILHVSSFSQALTLWRDVPEAAYRLAEVFFPGPLTVICKKSDIVPTEVTAGLDTVAVRMPSDKYAQMLISACGVPVAAPSANLSGRPSPTKAEHVIADMDGRIDAILCGDDCRYGVESTVISLVDEPVILRPGAVTPSMIAACGIEVQVAGSVLSPLKKGETAASPGMKYKHYSPDAKVVAVQGVAMDLTQKVCDIYDRSEGKKRIILASAENAPYYGDRCCEVIGKRSEPVTMCEKLFSSFRKYNDYDLIICEALSPDDEGLAYMNRLLRACGFHIE